MSRQAAGPLQSRIIHVLTAAALAATSLVSACSDHTVTQPHSRLAPQGAAKDVAPGSAGVLILASTVSGGMSSREAQAATALHLPVTLVSDAQWDAMTQADFAQYRAIVIGDPTCNYASGYTAAANNASVWGPMINGNIFIMGSDPVFHASYGANAAGAAKVTPNAIKFVTSAEGQTGAYISLSCAFEASSPTAVPMLSGLSPLGGFKSMIAADCYNQAHIVATSDALTGLSDGDLSGWSCAVHEIFTQWPSDFDVLAIARGLGAAYTASDGSTGTPYILARGKGLVIVSNVQLTPATDNKTINTPETITATVAANGSPVGGTTVTFTVVDGPNAGHTYTATTDASGVAAFSYSSTVEGTDGVRASYVDALGHTQTSNRVAITWSKPVDVTPPVVAHTITGGSPSASGWYSTNVTVTWTVTDPESTPTSTGCGTQTVTLTTGVDGTTLKCSATSLGGVTNDDVVIKLDKTVPTVTGAVTSGTLGANNWYVDNVGVTWTPSTPGPSGQTSSADCANVTLTTDAASHDFTCTITTGAGISSAQGKVTVKRDAQTPHISYQILGTPGNNGWYVSNVGVNWTTTAGPSGVNTCTSAPVTTDGTNITFSCTATAGNGKSASLTTTAVKRDATPPTVTYTGNAGSYTVDQTIAITCTPADNLSGVASSTCANITGDAYTFTLGTNSYSANAIDNAGNTSSTATTSFTVSATAASVCNLAARWADQGGIANSLCVKLNGGSYDAFRNELSAQRGKHIPADKADILLRLVNAL